jgi:hypothetical protein
LTGCTMSFPIKYSTGAHSLSSVLLFLRPILMHHKNKQSAITFKIEGNCLQNNLWLLQR